MHACKCGCIKPAEIAVAMNEATNRSEIAVAAKKAAEEAAKRKMPEMAKEVVLAAHNGDTERLRALLEANPNLVDAVR